MFSAQGGRVRSSHLAVGTRENVVVVAILQMRVRHPSPMRYSPRDSGFLVLDKPMSAPRMVLRGPARRRRVSKEVT